MAKDSRVVIHLECVECRKNGLPNVSRYHTVKNKKTTRSKLQLKKYCRFERKHTIHKETK